MKLRLLSAALAILVFAAGFGAAVWMQRHCPLPPPPVGFLGEIKNHSMDVHLPLNDPAALAQINAEIERLKPDIDAFRQKLDALNDEFRHQLDALLTPKQHEEFEKMHKRYEERRTQRANAAIHPPGGGATPWFPFAAEPIEGMTSIIIVPLTLDRLSDELKLDDHQKASLQQLLLNRREKFLALIDTTPPPSIRLNRIAPLINKLVGPPQPEKN